MNIIRCVSENWIVKNSPILKRQWGWFWASFRVRLASFSLNRVFNTDLLYSTTKIGHDHVSMSSFFAQVRLFRRKIKNFRVHYLRIQFVWAADAVSSKVSEGRFNEDKLQVNELPKLFAGKAHFFRTSRCFLHFKEKESFNLYSKKKPVWRWNSNGVNQCFGSGSGWIRVFSTIRIRVLKVRIRPFINLCDPNEGFDKVLEEPDQKRQCRLLRVRDVKHNIFSTFTQVLATC